MTRSTGLSGFFKKVFSIFLLFYLLFTVAAFSLAAEKPAPKRVSAIFVFKHGLPWAYRIEESLRKTMQSSVSVELDVEHADQSRFPEKQYQSKIVDLYRYKYSKRKIDLVLAVGDEATDLLLEYGASLFGHIPMMLINTNQKKLRHNLLQPNMVAIEWGFEYRKTIVLIQDLLPETKHIYVISETSTTDQRIGIGLLQHWIRYPTDLRSITLMVCR